MIGNIRNMRNITGLLSPISKELNNEIYNINRSFQLDRKLKKHLDTTVLDGINNSINQIAKDLEKEFYDLNKQLHLKNKIIVNYEKQLRKNDFRGSYQYFDIYNK